MSLTVITLIIFFGIILLLIEFLIIPGVTVAGIAGTLLIIGGVLLSYYYTNYGHYILAGSIISLVTLFIIAFKTKTWEKLGLKTSIDGKVGIIDEEIVKVGDSGETISRLVPIGKAMINDRLLEVRSNGNYIDPHTQIIVIRVQGNKIYVEPKNNSNGQ